MSADTREDHAAIWLQPECCAGYEGRLWCEHDEPVECDEGEPWTKYVRADRLEEAEGLLRESHRLLREIYEHYPFGVNPYLDDAVGESRSHTETIRELLEGDRETRDKES